MQIDTRQNPIRHLLAGRARSVLVACLLAAIGGCTTPTFTLAQLQARLQTATLISEDTSRDQALAAIATDAAHSKVEDVCVQAVDEIQENFLHDNTVIACAKQFNNDGNQIVAQALAIRANSDNVRDQVLAVMAKFGIPAPPASTAHKIGGL